MDFYERIIDHNEIMQSALDGRQASIWTAQPGIVTKVTDLAGKITLDVQPALQGKTRTPNGETKLVTIDSIPDVPVAFPRGGGYVLTFPIAVGDEVLLVHAVRNIDGWWQNGGIQPPLDSRMHDITDAFAIPGPYSQKTKFAGLSTTTSQFRTHDGKLLAELDHPNSSVKIGASTDDGGTPNGYIEVKSNATIRIEVGDAIVSIVAAKDGTLDVVANTQVNITAPTVLVSGDVHVTGEIIAGYGTNDQVSLRSHRHGTGTPAAGTSVPTPGT